MPGLRDQASESSESSNYMKEPNYLSTAQVAAALGVGVSTVKRWVDEEILPAHRTPGGHRKLLLADVLRLVKDGRFPNLDVKRLLTTGSLETSSTDEIAQELYAALKEGAEAEARAVIEKAYDAGMPLVQMADRIIAPAMYRIGHAWQTEVIDIFHEHRATQMVAGALFALKARLEDQTRPLRPVALGGAPEGDPYLLPSLLIEMILLEQGWDAVNLGPNTPLASFEKALGEFRPRLLWVSASFLSDRGRFLREYAALYSRAQQSEVAVAVGGQALTGDLRSQMLFTTHGDTFAHLVEFARTLNPPPQPPRRGRPPQTESGR